MPQPFSIGSYVTKPLSVTRQETDKTLVWVGALVVAGVCAVLAFVAIWVIGQFAAEFDHFQMRFAGGVSGIGDGTLVKYNGVDVGKVSSIELDKKDPKKVLVIVSVRQGLCIRNDSVATIQSSSLAGITSFVEIAGGSVTAPLAVIAKHEPYAELRTKESGFAQLGTEFSQLKTKFGPLEENWNALNTAENKSALDRIGKNFSIVSGVIEKNDSRFASIKRSYSGIERNTDALSVRSKSLNVGFNNVSKSFQNVQTDTSRRFDEPFNNSLSLLWRELSRVGKGFGEFFGLVKDHPIALVKGKPDRCYSPSNSRTK